MIVLIFIFKNVFTNLLNLNHLALAILVVNINNKM